MRVALAGKGGAGKTTISATLCRLVARAGSPVVAIDGDSNPNLALALGIDQESAAPGHRSCPPRWSPGASTAARPDRTGRGGRRSPRDPTGLTASASC